MKTKYIISLLPIVLLLGISLVSASGTLETARIGIEANLTNSNVIEFSIKASNPSNESLNVSLIAENFTELDSNKQYNIITNIEPSNYILSLNESKEFKVYGVVLNDGKYEGNIKVTFIEGNSSQKITLNSAIQILAFGSNNKTDFLDKFKYYIIIIIVIISLIFLWIKFIRNTIERRLKNNEKSNNSSISSNELNDGSV